MIKREPFSVSAKTIQCYEKPLQEAIEWCEDQTKTTDPKSLKLDGKYARLAELKVIVQKGEAPEDRLCNLLYEIVKKYRQHLVEQQNTGANRKRLQYWINQLDKYIDEVRPS
jgi:hypothetical protein